MTAKDLPVMPDEWYEIRLDTAENWQPLAVYARLAPARAFANHWLDLHAAYRAAYRRVARTDPADTADRDTAQAALLRAESDLKAISPEMVWAVVEGDTYTAETVVDSLRIERVKLFPNDLMSPHVVADMTFHVGGPAHYYLIETLRPRKADADKGSDAA